MEMTWLDAVTRVLDKTNMIQDGSQEAHDIVEQVVERSKDVTMGTSKKRTSFSDLPNELRVEIYELVLDLDERDFMVLWPKKYLSTEIIAENAAHKLNHHRLYAISMCSRRVRSEFMAWYIPRMCSKDFLIPDAISPAAPSFELTTKFLSSWPVWNAALVNPRPMHISINNMWDYEFESKDGLLQAVKSIPGIEILIPGSRIEVMDCSMKDVSAVDLSVHHREYDCYTATFLFDVGEDGIQFRSLCEVSFWKSYVPDRLLGYSWA